MIFIGGHLQDARYNFAIPKMQGAMYKSPKVLYMVVVVVGVKGPGQGRREHAATTGGKGGRLSR